MKKLNLGLILITATLATACGKQPPAPVVSGFEQPERDYASRAYTGSTRLQEKVYKPSGRQTLYHVVTRGDTLWDIAQKYDTTTGEVKVLNNLESSTLRVGQRLKVKETSDAAARSVAAGSGSFTSRVAGRNKAVSAEKPAASASEKTNRARQVNKRLHRVRAGENLFRIGLKYNVSPLDIMAVNDIDKPEDLQAGSVITVPIVSEAATVTGTRQERTVNERLARQRGLIWPARGRVISKFGRESDGVVNNGIKIKVAANTPVHAAEDGEVIYADDGIKTFGNLILLRHNNGLITAYAHASELLVAKGEKVEKGEVIARAGQTGNVGEPQLHFEVRRNARAIDPLKILPNG